MRNRANPASLSKLNPDSLTLLRGTVSVLFVCAMAGLVLTATLGFEEPDDTLLLLTTLPLVAAFAAVFAHLRVTHGLDGRQKRLWLRQLTGRRAIEAWSEYLTCDDLRAALGRLSDADSQRARQN